MSSTEPVALYGHGTLIFGSGQLTDNRPKGYTPNPAKVAMSLEELELPPYDHRKVMVDLAVVKEESYVFIHPNRRLPALRDPVLHPSSPQQFLVKKQPCFQISRQVRSPHPRFSSLLPVVRSSLLAPTFATAFVWGPYFGQLSWFKILYSEDVHSAKQRYEEQTVRILSVLYRALGAKWGIDGKYPDYVDWTARVRARPVVDDVLKTMSRRRAEEREKNRVASCFDRAGSTAWQREACDGLGVPPAGCAVIISIPVSYG
ncbi:hypothetical protein QIS74_06024 [Colletotrichum tabaci]|uniref:glutathione transferase n=1 Tax=Colletotrichum tabaci TaxID=1209068 RepID=A0AAV9TH13_9PEZI